MARNYRPRNRYYRGSKISEERFATIVRMFTLCHDASEIAKATGVSQRSVNQLLIKLRKRVFEDTKLDPFALIRGTTRVPADSPIWQKHRACLYDCPTLRGAEYPTPVAMEVSTIWHPSDYAEWCGLCHILPHRRHPLWRALEVWSRFNNGIPQADYAHHVVYVMLFGYTQVIEPMDWRALILTALERDPL